MFVHRVLQWLHRLVGSPSTYQRDLPASEERTPALVGAGTGRQATPHGDPQAHAVPHWLAAARRLRPPRTISIAPTANAGRPAKPGAEREQVAASRPRPQKPVEAPESPARAEGIGLAPTSKPLPAPSPAPAPAPTPQPLPAPTSQPLPAEQAASAPHLSREEYALRRRLMSLKHLVRMGVYNEGFKGEQAPEQYRRSLGHGEDDAFDQE